MENVTRRSFVQGAAAATAVVAGAGIVASARADEAPAEETPAEAAVPAAVQTFAGGRMRPEPHTGHPMPMTTGYVGPDAMPIAPSSLPRRGTSRPTSWS